MTSRFIVGLLFIGSLFVECKKSTFPPPNILYINIDDLGWMDTNPYGSTFYETPHISSIAQSGMLFKRAYAGAANCAPSRASLLTGLNTPRHGIFTVGSSERGKSEHRKLIPVENKTVLADSFVTIAEVLKSNGFRTASFGKWHLGEDPVDQGFDVNFGGDSRGNPGRTGYFNPAQFPNMEASKAGSYLTDELTSQAINFISESKSKPFFTYLSFYSVHTPLRAKEPVIQKYKDKGGNELQNHVTYAAMIESVDENIGRILNHLKRNKLLHNTLIIFTSDNGGIREISSQHPLRGGKGSYYEGGIRVPFIASWPDKIARGTVNNTPITGLDFFPTILEILDIKYDNYTLDGNSILPLFLGQEMESRPLYWHFPIYLQAYAGPGDDARDTLFRTRPGSIIIVNDLKLHHYFEDNAIEMYNLIEDTGERTDISQQEPMLAKQLYSQLENWRKEIKAPIPTILNPEYQID